MISNVPDSFKIRFENHKQSAQFQRGLLKLGFCWASGDNNVKHISQQMMIIADRRMSVGGGEDYFKDNSLTEVFYNDLFPTDWKSIMEGSKDD